jgi:hypothetical protein
MQIRFVSTLTAEDEERLAEALVETVRSLLAAFPIGYTFRVETNRMRVFEHNRVFDPVQDVGADARRLP